MQPSAQRSVRSTTPSRSPRTLHSSTVATPRAPGAARWELEREVDASRPPKREVDAGRPRTRPPPGSRRKTTLGRCPAPVSTPPRPPRAASCRPKRPDESSHLCIRWARLVVPEPDGHPDSTLRVRISAASSSSDQPSSPWQICGLACARADTAPRKSRGAARSREPGTRSCSALCWTGPGSPASGGRVAGRREALAGPSSKHLAAARAPPHARAAAPRCPPSGPAELARRWPSHGRAARAAAPLAAVSLRPAAAPPAGSCSCAPAQSTAPAASAALVCRTTRPYNAR